MSAPVASVEDGLGAAAAKETQSAQDARAAPTGARTARSSSRRLSSLLLLPGVALLLLFLGLAAVSSSFQRAYDIHGRVTRLHAVAPQGADSATLLLDVDMEPRRWSPHRVTLHSAKCRVRVHGVDVLAHVPEIRYTGPTRASFPARVEASSASELEPDPEPQCEFQSSLDLFGSGLVVPRTVYPSLATTAPQSPAMPRPKVWMQRASSPTLRGTWNSSLSLEQLVNVSVQVPAGSLPQFLHDLLGGTQISVEGAVTYSEEEDGSVMITKAVNSRLVAERDGRGGYLLSLPMYVSGRVLPAAFATTAAKAVVGRSQPRDGALPAEDGSVDRSVRLVAEAPRSPMAQYLGTSHVVGWRSQQGSSVSDMVRDARRQLGRRLARSVMGSDGKHDLVMPPMVDQEQGRRLGLLDSGKVAFKETFYYDTYRTDMEWTVVIKEDSMDLAIQVDEDGESYLTVQLDIADSEDASSAIFDMTVEGYHVGTFDVTNSDEQGMSLNAHIRDPYSGSAIVDISAARGHDQDDHVTVRLYNAEERFEIATLEYFDTTSEFGLDLKLLWPYPWEGPVLTAALEGVRDHDLTSTGFAIALYHPEESDVQTLVLNGTIEDAYGQEDGFSLDAVMVVGSAANGAFQLLTELFGSYMQVLFAIGYNPYIRRLSYMTQAVARYTQGSMDEGTFSVTVEGTHADQRLDASASVEAVHPSHDNVSFPLFALDPLVVTTRAEQFSVESIVLDALDAIVSNFSFSLTNEPPGMGQQVVQIDSFDLEIVFSGPPGDSFAPCLHGSCALMAGLRDSVLDVDFESKSGTFTVYSAAVDAKALDAEWSAAVELSTFADGRSTYWGFVTLDNTGSGIALDQFDLESAGGHIEGPDTPVSWHWVLDREPSSFILDGRIFGYQSGNETADEVLNVGVSVVEFDGSTTSLGHVYYDDNLMMKWEAELTEDEAAGMEAFAMTYFDGFSGDPSDPLFNVSAICVSEESTGTLTFTLVATDRVRALEPFGSLGFQRVDFGQSASVEAWVNNSDNERFGSLSAAIDFTSAPPSRLLSDWDAGVHCHLGSPYNITDVIYSGSLAATSSGGIFSSEMSITSGGGAIETWSLTGTSSAERIDASGALSESGSIVAIAFTKPGGMLNELGAMTADITVEIGSPVIQVSLDYDGEMQFEASAHVAEGESHIFSGAATLHEQWVALVSHSHFEQDLFDMGLNSVYEYFNMSIFAVETSDGVCELWQESYVQTNSAVETANVSVRFSTDEGEVTDFSLLAYALSRDRMTGMWAPSMNLSLRSGQILATNRIEGSFTVEVHAAKAVDFTKDARVITAFERVVAGKAGVSIADVDVALSVASGRGRRLSSAMQAGIMVSYAISVHVTAEGGSEALGRQAALDIPRAMQEVTVEEFADDFNEELRVLGEDVATLFSVEAVSDSAVPPQVPTTTTLTTTTLMQDPGHATTAMPQVPAMSTTSAVGEVNGGEDIGDDVSGALLAADTLAAVLIGLLGALVTLVM